MGKVNKNLSSVQKEIIFTVDLEDWYQGGKFKTIIKRDSWDTQEIRVRDNTFKILELLDNFNAKGTFFCLGYVVKNHRDLIKEIHNKGHEIASHGFNHEFIYKQSYKDFQQDILDTKHLIEDIISDKVIGYRAPNFSITDWAVDILKESGYVYDSSFFPFYFRGDYGKLENAPKHYKKGLYKFTNGLLEIPLSMFKFFNWSLPWSGGGYFRLIPYKVYIFGINRIINIDKFFTFYIHPWDIDWSQPRIKNLPAIYKFRHYVNLKSAYKKLFLLAQNYRFCPISKFIEREDKLDL